VNFALPIREDCEVNFGFVEIFECRAEFGGVLFDFGTNPNALEI
jgi:hypothetical protein